MAWRAAASLVHGRRGELPTTRKHQGGRVQSLHTHQARNAEPATYRGTHSRKLWGHTYPVLGFHQPSGVSKRNGKWATHKVSAWHYFNRRANLPFSLRYRLKLFKTPEWDMIIRRIWGGGEAFTPGYSNINYAKMVVMYNSLSCSDLVQGENFSPLGSCWLALTCGTKRALRCRIIHTLTTPTDIQ
jgi:hypothetical protein